MWVQWVERTGLWIEVSDNYRGGDERGVRRGWGERGGGRTGSLGLRVREVAMISS